MSEHDDEDRAEIRIVTPGPFDFVVNNRPILTFTPEGEVVFGAGVEPSAAAREFWTFLAHANPLRVEVERLRTENEGLVLMGTGATQMAGGAYARLRRLADENAALREIARAVAAIRETGRGDPGEPYDAQISLLTITKARALLGAEEEGA